MEIQFNLSNVDLADGVAFVIQNYSATAVGTSGKYMGYVYIFFYASSSKTSTIICQSKIDGGFFFF
jgi:hypothetical protein